MANTATRLPASTARLTTGTATARSSQGASERLAVGVRASSPSGKTTLVVTAWATFERFLRLTVSVPVVASGGAVTSRTTTFAGGGLPVVTRPTCSAWNGYWLRSV